MFFFSLKLINAVFSYGFISRLDKKPILISTKHHRHHELWLEDNRTYVGFVRAKKIIFEHLKKTHKKNNLTDCSINPKSIRRFLKRFFFFRDFISLTKYLTYASKKQRWALNWLKNKYSVKDYFTIFFFYKQFN